MIFIYKGSLKEVSMKVDVRTIGDVAVLDLKGKFVLGESEDAFREGLVKALDGGKTKLLLNIKDVSVMDSTGLGEVVRAKATCAKKNAQIKLLNVHGKIYDLLMLTQLTGVFEIVQDEAKAVEGFK
jgi:anti-sigma B factor antagonist